MCRPEEALDCFLRTQMDMLVLGDQVIDRVVTSRDGEAAARANAAATP